MIRFFLNIMMIIITVYSVSWSFLIRPILQVNQHLTNEGLFISSIYQVLNISLLFSAVCLYLMLKSIKNKMSLYFIIAGFSIQVVADFCHVNHFETGFWLFISWPLSGFLIGLSSVLARMYPWQPDDEQEKMQYKNNYFAIFSAGVLLMFTFFQQNNNILEKGLRLTVILLLIQQTITALENRDMFARLKSLANLERELPDGKQGGKMNHEMAKLLKKIETLAHYDALTQLPNRYLFQKSMDQTLKMAKENLISSAVMFIDLDRFKYVNDSFGHDCGDLLLKKAAGLIQEAAGGATMVARIGGDEFAVILPESNPVHLEKVANAILQKFNQPIQINGCELFTTLSIGIAIYPGGGRSANDLLKNADAAMYKAKEEGRNRFAFYDESLNETITTKVTLETKMRKALDEEAFDVYYQPQVDLKTEKTIGF